jgi:ribosome-binding protein aMBF1 (putative translation factor)
MISSSQIRAAKALLRWSGEDLANKAGLSLSTIRRVEASEGVPDTQNMKTLLSIMKALEEAGIEFIGAPDDRPGVRLK